MILDAAGNLYGAAARGGVSGDGVVFKLDPAGKETVLYAFDGELQTGVPVSGVIFDPAGNLYGVNAGGGKGGYGGVYRLDPAGHLTVLYSFTTGNETFSGLTRDPAGNLYGTNGSTLYKLDRKCNHTPQIPR